MALAQQQELQSQVIALQGGESSIISDDFGLMLPPNQEAITWLKDFWATGKPNNRGSPAKAPADVPRSRQSGVWKKMSPRMERSDTTCGDLNQSETSKTNVLIVPAGDEWSADM